MSRRLVTAGDVQQAHDSGHTIAITHDTILTPAARDLARELGGGMTAPAPSRPPVPPATAGPIIALGADHGGIDLKDHLMPWLIEIGYEVLDIGTTGKESVDYPIFAARVAEEVASGRARYGIMVDGAGIGSCMVANKIAGARAAMCYDITTASNAREHNNANVLTLGGTLIGHRLAKEIVTTFLNTEFGHDRHTRRVAMIDGLDQQ